MADALSCGAPPFNAAQCGEFCFPFFSKKWVSVGFGWFRWGFGGRFVEFLVGLGFTGGFRGDFFFWFQLGFGGFRGFRFPGGFLWVFCWGFWGLLAGFLVVLVGAAACNARFLGGWDSVGVFGGFWGFWGLLVSVEFFVGFCWVLGGFAGIWGVCWVVGILVGFNRVWGFVGDNGTRRAFSASPFCESGQKRFTTRFQGICQKSLFL